MTRVLLSGASGFVGHHLAFQILKRTDWEIIAFDRLSSPLSRRRWADLNLESFSRIKLVKVDFSENISDAIESLIGNIEYVIHLGAETDINKSIANPFPFIKSNVVGTYNFLELARKQPNLQYFVYVSTNEVFGNGQPGEKFDEWHKYNCLNPYSATKAASEELTLAFSSSYQIPIMILRTMNLFGERQDPRKFIPRIVHSIINGIQVPIYTNASGDVGSRAYFHLDSFVSALFYLLDLAKAKPAVDNIDWDRDKFNVAAVEPLNNLALAQQIAKIMGKTFTPKVFDFYSNQPAHELHSALDCSRLMKLGWSPNETFDMQLEKTVQWLIDNPEWL